MRTPVEHVANDGTRTYKIKFRHGGSYTSETFRNRADAVTFAAILDNNITDALAWIRERDKQSSAVTLGTWFEDYVDQLTGVSPRTRNDYRSLHRRYLGHLDQLPLPLITRSHVTALVNQLERDGRAPRTIKDTVSLLSTVLALAIDQGHMTTNPCKRVRLPQQSIDEHEDRFLTYEEFARLHDATPDHYKPLVAFLVGTGMRWSEATAMQGKHVNLEAGTMFVRQAWKRVPGEGFRLGPPKTPKSRRTVNPALMALEAAATSMQGREDFVFRTKTGGPVRHANFYSHVWSPACKRAGFDPPPWIRDLRNTHASWLLSAGVSLEQVQDQLGHESILTTRKIYGHLMPALGVEVGRAASAALERALATRPAITAGPADTA